MKKYYFTSFNADIKSAITLLTTSYFLLSIFLGCASTKHQIKATSPNTELVEAEGFSPIINNDISKAKESALHDALRNALGLVIGVYVSQEALVSKAVLIEENITSETEGYIEKYNVLKEWRDGNFYKTKIKALVRKEDLSAKLKALELEPKKLGNPVVKFSIKEFIDNKPSDNNYAEMELKNKFVGAGFTVSETEEPSILILARADSNFNTDEGLGGLISYRATVSVKVIKAGADDVITAHQETAGGIDVTKPAAAKASILNALKKIGDDLPERVLKFLKESAVIHLTVSNVENMNKLNDFTRSVRALIEVRDCWVRTFSDGIASLDLSLRKGNASIIAKRLEQSQNFSIKIVKLGTYEIKAELR